MAESLLLVAHLFARLSLTEAFSREVGNALPPDPPEGIVDQNPDDPVRRVELVRDDHVVGRHLVAATTLALLVIQVGRDVVVLVDPSQDVIRRPVVRRHLLREFDNQALDRGGFGDEDAVLVLEVEDDRDVS
ncbi:MAG: hypothetical protein ABSH35_22775 [Isosphaeraceae bacterium]